MPKVRCPTRVSQTTVTIGYRIWERILCLWYGHHFIGCILGEVSVCPSTRLPPRDETDQGRAWDAQCYPCRQADTLCDNHFSTSQHTPYTLPGCYVCTWELAAICCREAKKICKRPLAGYLEFSLMYLLRLKFDRAMSVWDNSRKSKGDTP